MKSINHYVTSFQVTQQTGATNLVSYCPLVVAWNECNSSPFYSIFLPLDSNVRAREVAAEGQSVAAGVLEHHRLDGHPHILRRHGSAPAGAAAHELRPSHLLRQHHLLVHPAAGYLWGQQVPGSLCDDDWQNGEQRRRGGEGRGGEG